MRRLAQGTLRWTKRVLVLTVLAAVVLGFGLIVSDPNAEHPSATQQAQHTAAQAAHELAEDARRLAGNQAASPMVAAADILDRQAVLLQVPVASGDSAEASPSPKTSPKNEPTVEEFVVALRSSAGRNLDQAEETEPGIARLLASIGTAQWILANDISSAAAPPPQPVEPAADPGRQQCMPEEEPGDEVQAVRAVQLAEYRVAYAYEVTAARTGSPFLQDKAQAHRSAAGELAGILNALCAEMPPPVDAYVLSPNYFTDPAPVLTAMESELITSYADLVGLSNGAVRKWAIGTLLSATLALHEGGDAPDPTPGLRNIADSTKVPAGKTP